MSKSLPSLPSLKTFTICRTLTSKLFPFSLKSLEMFPASACLFVLSKFQAPLCFHSMASNLIRHYCESANNVMEATNKATEMFHITKIIPKLTEMSFGREGSLLAWNHQMDSLLIQNIHIIVCKLFRVIATDH